MAKITKEQLIESLKEMTLVEVKDWIDAVSEAFGVSAAAPVAAAGPAADAAPAAPTVVSVILVNAGTQKVAVIKAYREATGLGLIDAKNAVEKGGVVIKDGIKPEEAAEVKKTFEAAGATVKIE